MTHTTRSPLLLLVLPLVVVALAACAGPSPVPDGLPDPDGPGNTADGETPPEVRAPKTSEECLAAQWLLNNETWRAMLQPMTVAAGGTVESVTGEMALDLRPDGIYTSTYTDWTVTTLAEGGKAVIQRNGVDLGTWAISGTQVALVETNPGSAVVGYVETGAGRIDLPPTGTDSASLDVFEFDCAPEDLLATIEMGTVFFTLRQ